MGEHNGGLEERTAMLISHNLIMTTVIIMKYCLNYLYKARMNVIKSDFQLCYTRKYNAKASIIQRVPKVMVQFQAPIISGPDTNGF
jgi:hypothetical protein